MTWVVGGALTVTALAVSVAYWVASTHKEKPVILPQSVPIDVHQQLSGYTFTRSDGGRRVFTVHAARTVSFKQGGTTVLDDVLVELFGRTGNRRDIMRTQRCDYNSQNGDLFSSGPVQIELNAQAEKAAGRGLERKADSLPGDFEGVLPARGVAGNERPGGALPHRAGFRNRPGNGLRNQRWLVGAGERRGDGVAPAQRRRIGSPPAAYRQPPSL